MRYWSLSNREHRRVCNGVGSQVGLLGKLTYHLIPDTAWFMSLKPVANIHDYDYEYPQKFNSLIDAFAHKKMADNRFRENGIRLVRWHGGPQWLQTLREIRVIKYHLVLSQCGTKSFLDEKSIG